MPVERSKSLMADFKMRHPLNVPGKFYVDNQCTDCDLCREIARETFKRDADNGCTYVYRQPVTEEEINRAMEAVESCPCEEIGANGDTQDWNMPTGFSPDEDTRRNREKYSCDYKHTEPP
jgi:ferredoxin